MALFLKPSSPTLLKFLLLPSLYILSAEGLTFCILNVNAYCTSFHKYSKKYLSKFAKVSVHLDIILYLPYFRATIVTQFEHSGNTEFQSLGRILKRFLGKERFLIRPIHYGELYFTVVVYSMLVRKFVELHSTIIFLLILCAYFRNTQ